jgi:hypothetical protein
MRAHPGKDSAGAWAALVRPNTRPRPAKDLNNDFKAVALPTQQDERPGRYLKQLTNRPAQLCNMLPSAMCYTTAAFPGMVMTKDQRTVAIGAASGIVGMILLVWALSSAIPAPDIADEAGARLAYALKWAVVAAIPLFAMIVAVGNARFLSEAIDPTLAKEDHKMVVNGRVADNTLQQFVLFLVGMFALSVSLPLERLSTIAAVALTFVIARLIFWVGYRVHPLYRAPGFSSVAYMNLFMFFAVIWLWVK